MLESEKYIILNEDSKLIIVGVSAANELNLQVANNYEEAFKHINNLKIWTLNTSTKKNLNYILARDLLVQEYFQYHPKLIIIFFAR